MLLTKKNSDDGSVIDLFQSNPAKNSHISRLDSQTWEHVIASFLTVFGMVAAIAPLF